jgi:hypothetical protein
MTMSTARVEPIPLARIKDAGAQMRVEMRPETANDYAIEMLDGATFPPVVVFDDGTDLWLADGFHRVEAARKIDREEITAEIRQGTARDAILMAPAPMPRTACAAPRRTSGAPSSGC